MALRAFIGSTELELPNNFEFPIERYSPWYDGSLRIGDLSIGIEFPITAQNRLAFGFADELHQAHKVIHYPDFRLEDDGEFVRGILSLTQIKPEGHISRKGSFITTFATNRIPQLNEPLHEVLTKVVDLGSSTAAIIASAAAQNLAAMSQDGITGAVMKFVPHQNTLLFDKDVNPNWYPEAEPYDGTMSYPAGSMISHNNSYAIDNPTRFIARVEIPVGHSPSIYRYKWTLYPNGIANDWDSDNSSFYINESVRVGGKFLKNRHALVPWLQLMDVIRNLAASIGYTLVGHFPNDVVEQRILMPSNYALCKPSKYFLKLQLNDTFDENVLFIPQSAGPIGTTLQSVVMDPPEENDIEEMFDPDLTYDQTVTITRKGDYIMRVAGFIWIDQPADTEVQLAMMICEMDYTILKSTIVSYDPGTFVDGAVYFEIEVEYAYDYEGADDTVSKALILQTEVLYAGVNGGVMTNTIIEWENMTYHNIDLYDGKVTYANHVPDITVGSFLTALRDWRNLDISFDPQKRELRMDYLDSIIRTQGKPRELTASMVSGAPIDTLPEKRYEISYGVSPGETDISFPGYTKLDPINTITEIHKFILGNNIAPYERRAVLVRSVNAWLVTGPSEYGSRNVWRHGAHNYPPIKIQLSENPSPHAELINITPALGPIAMSWYRNAANKLISGPVMDVQGRASGFGQTGDRAPFYICYWIGMDTSTIVEGYPLASPVRYNTAGNEVLSRDMTLPSVYSYSWKRTLQLLVLEERVKAAFRFPPEIRQLITFANMQLLGHVPIIPIRTAQQFTQRGASHLEIEARKVKMVEIKIVSSEQEEDGGESEPWTPKYLGGVVWADVADEDSLTIDAGSIIQIDDKFGNGNNFTVYAWAQAPTFVNAAYNGLPTARFTGTKGMVAPSISALDVNTISVFAVTMANGSASASFLICGQYSTGAGGSSDRLWEIYNSAVTEMRSIVRNSTGASTQITGSISADALFQIGLVWYGSTSVSQFVHGALNNTLPGTNAIPNGHARLLLGGRGAAFSNKYLGDICEVLVFNTAIDETTRQKIEGYLAWKWGIENELPIIHPYRLAKPMT